MAICLEQRISPAAEHDQERVGDAAVPPGAAEPSLACQRRGGDPAAAQRRDRHRCWRQLLSRRAAAVGHPSHADGGSDRTCAGEHRVRAADAGHPSLESLDWRRARQLSRVAGGASEFGTEPVRHRHPSRDPWGDVVPVGGDQRTHWSFPRPPRTAGNQPVAAADSSRPPSGWLVGAAACAEDDSIDSAEPQLGGVVPDRDRDRSRHESRHCLATAGVP